MDSMDWIMVLLAIQTSLIAMIFFQSGMFGRGFRQYEETLASRVAGLIGNIMQQPHTETATMNLMIKALESQKTQEAASAFIRKLVMQLLEESLHLSDSFHKHGDARLEAASQGTAAQRGCIAPVDGENPEDGSSSSSSAVATSEFRRRPVPTTCKAEPVKAAGTDDCGVVKRSAGLHLSSSAVLPQSHNRHHHDHHDQQQQSVSLGADGPSPEEMRSLLTSGMERTRRIVEHEMLSSETVDLIVTMIAKVVEDKRLEHVVITMLSKVLAKDEVTEALSKSITGVGSSVAGRFLPNALLKATGHSGKSTRPPS